MPIKIIIADDHSLFRKGLMSVLNGYHEIDIAGGAADGKEALKMALEMKPDVLLLDLQMPVMDGYEVLKNLKKEKSGVKIIVISIFEEDRTISYVIKEGACGFLSKNAEPDEVVLAIKSAKEHGYYFNDRVSKAILHQAVKRKHIIPFCNSALVEFDEQDMTILQLLSEDLTSEQIGEKMHLGIRTIESRRHEMLQKTDSRTAIGLIMYALKHGLLDI